jgi:hypothetical protein
MQPLITSRPAPRQAPCTDLCVVKLKSYQVTRSKEQTKDIRKNKTFNIYIRKKQKKLENIKKHIPYNPLLKKRLYGLSFDY